jgi:hypothetical protein
VHMAGKQSSWAYFCGVFLFLAENPLDLFWTVAVFLERGFQEFQFLTQMTDDARRLLWPAPHVCLKDDGETSDVNIGSKMRRGFLIFGNLWTVLQSCNVRLYFRINRSVVCGHTNWKF